MMKYSTYLIHYNHNHDKLGRFAKRMGGVSDSVIKKGTNLNRVSKTKDKKKWKESDGRTYVSSSKLDEKIYTYGSVVLGADTKMNLETKKDLKVAGKKAQVDAFIETLDKVSAKDMAAHVDYLDTAVNPRFKKFMDGMWEVKTKKVEKLFNKVDKNQKNFETAYDAFIMNVSNDTKASKIFYENLRKKGYDAAVDDYDTRWPNDLGITDYYETKRDPLPSATGIRSESAMIIFDRHKSTRLKSIKQLKQSDIDRAKKWLEDNGYYEQVINHRFVIV